MFIKVQLVVCNMIPQINYVLEKWRFSVSDESPEAAFLSSIDNQRTVCFVKHNIMNLLKGISGGLKKGLHLFRRTVNMTTEI